MSKKSNRQHFWGSVRYCILTAVAVVALIALIVNHPWVRLVKDYFAKGYKEMTREMVRQEREFKLKQREQIFNHQKANNIIVDTFALPPRIDSTDIYGVKKMNSEIEKTLKGFPHSEQP